MERRVGFLFATNNTNDMNYQIITNPNEVQRFVDWLPDLESHEKFYACLFARSKYTKHLEDPLAHIKSDKAQLKRFTARKEDLFYKILQLTCPIGAYRQKEKAVPQEALALYLAPNPRDLYRSQFTALTALSKCIQNQNRNANPHQEVMSEIQRNKSRAWVVGFDIDVNKEDYLLDFVWQVAFKCVNLEAVSIIETRGGYHILIKPSLVEDSCRKTWYNDLKKSTGVDQTGDIMVPVPGTYQGGFTPILHLSPTGPRGDLSSFNHES